jgi:hypothetical protein
MGCAFVGETNFNIIKMHGTTIKIMGKFIFAILKGISVLMFSGTLL